MASSILASEMYRTRHPFAISEIVVVGGEWGKGGGAVAHIENVSFTFDTTQLMNG